MDDPSAFRAQVFAAKRALDAGRAATGTGASKDGGSAAPPPASSDATLAVLERIELLVREAIQEARFVRK